MSDNVPEIVDLDEAFNGIDPELLQAVLVKNLTHTVQLMCSQASKVVMPTALAGVMGVEITAEDFKQVILDIMKRIAVIKDLNDLINKVVPIHDEGMTEAQREIIKESITRHPIIVEAAFRITETIEQKLDRKFNGQ